MNFIRGCDRSQVQLLPAAVDDYVSANAAVRFMDAFVEKLDLADLGFEHAQPAETGRPPYNPRDLLKLYLYGYLHRIRSSRRLEAEARRNLEVIWLLRGLAPDFKTIADFRKDNREAFKPLFKQFNLICRRLNLFGAELVAIDGSKFKGVNSVKHHYNLEQLEELEGKIEKRIEEYLSKLETSDEEAEGTRSAMDKEELEKKIKKLEERKGQYARWLEEMKQAGQTEISLIDGDARGMQKVGVGYNVQVAVDQKHHLIVEAQVVTSACDRGQLSGMAQAAKEELGVEKLSAVADAGYHEADQLENCEKAGIETYVPDTGKVSGLSRDGKTVFPKEQFIYEAEADQYRCPAGQVLARAHVATCRGKARVHYVNRPACRRCPLKEQCTSGAYREICRRTNEAVVDRQAVRLAAHPEIMAQRKQIVEHVFGTLRNWGHDDFLMRGLKKVRGEFALSALAYNFRRVLNLVSMTECLKALA
jgi:transposase